MAGVVTGVGPVEVGGAVGGELISAGLIVVMVADGVEEWLG